MLRFANLGMALKQSSLPIKCVPSSVLIPSPIFLMCQVAIMSQRMLSMHDINKNLYLCTPDDRKIDIDKKSLRFKQEKENTKPIVLMISWFYGQKNHINKYSKLYTDEGFDVLVGRISLVQSLFAIKSIEQFGQDIADVLHSNEDHYKEIFIHTFSGGGGMWGITQRMMKKDLNKYGNIPQRVLGQVWDSIVHHETTIVAIPLALFPNNLIMRNLTRTILWIHLTLYRALDRHLADAVENLHNNMARAPALVFASKTDQLGTVKFASGVVDKWRANGMDVTLKVFENSPHVKHFQTYPDEYLKLLHDHWKLVKLLERK